MSDAENDASGSRKGSKLRRGHKKVKTGCTDCRRRRVKVSADDRWQRQLTLTLISALRKSQSVGPVNDVGLNVNTYLPKYDPSLQTLHRPRTSDMHPHLSFDSSPHSLVWHPS